MLDLKVMNSALEQLEEERGISKDQILEAVEDALAAAYKKDYGKKGQIIRADFDLGSGKTEFFQIKIVVDDTTVKIGEEEETEEDVVADKKVERQNKDKKEEVGKKDKTDKKSEEVNEAVGDETTEEYKPKYNPEHHILLEDAQKIKKNAKINDEIVFPLEAKSDYGRIAAQTAKQVIIQRVREAEKMSVMSEYVSRKGEVISGLIQRVERGNVFIDLGRTVAILPSDEQIQGEYYRQGSRIKAYLFSVEEGPRGINLKLSRTHPQFLQQLFEIEAPEIASGIVEIKSIAREPGSRSKIAVMSHDDHIDPIGACVGQRGVRVSTIMNELNGEKIDIIPWSDDAERFIADSLSPARVDEIEVFENEKRARVVVEDEQLSLSIGRGGQNVRLAAKLTGWKIDIEGITGEKTDDLNSDETEISGDVEKEEKPSVDTSNIKDVVATKEDVEVKKEKETSVDDSEKSEKEVKKDEAEKEASSDSTDS